MKKQNLFSMLILTIALYACGQNNIDNPSIPFVLDNAAKEKLNQTIPSTATSASSITFEASLPWTATVNVTRADSWITVTPDHGDAGVQTVTFTLLPNESSESRSATILFTCEGGSFTVTIVQEGSSSSGNNGEYVKHPSVAPNDRISHVTIDQEGFQSKYLLVFTYGEDGSLSSVKEYVGVENGSCQPSNVEETVFDRSSGESSFRMIRTEKVGKDIQPGPDGLVQIGDKYKSDPERIISLYLNDLPIYENREEKFFCKRTGMDLHISGAGDDAEAIDFSYDADGNILLIKEADGYSIEGEWTEGNMVSATAKSTDYFSDSAGNVTERQETERIDIRYSDHLNSFHGVSINAFVLEDYFGAGPFFDDDLAGLQTKNLPVRLEQASSLGQGNGRVTDISYTFDDSGRVVTMSVLTPEKYDYVYHFHYNPQTPPNIAVSEDPASMLVSQEIVGVEYDSEAAANAISVYSKFADGHSVTDRLYPVMNYPIKMFPVFLYPDDPSSNPNVTNNWNNVTAEQYASLGNVTVRQESVDEEVAGEDPNLKLKSVLYSLNYGKTTFYTRLNWNTHSQFDYIAWWDGSEIKYVVCKHYVLQPEDALLQPLGNWYIENEVFSGNKMISCALCQPLSLVWPKLGQPISLDYVSFNAEIYINFVEGGI